MQVIIHWAFIRCRARNLKHQQMKKVNDNEEHWMSWIFWLLFSGSVFTYVYVGRQRTHAKDSTNI